MNHVLHLSKFVYASLLAGLCSSQFGIAGNAASCPDEAAPRKLETGIQCEVEIAPITINSSCRELTVFTASNQFLKLNRGDTLLTAVAGTALTQQSDRLVLHKGSLLLDTGAKPICVATRAAGIKVQPNSTVLVEYYPGGRIKIETLQSTEMQTRIAFANQPERAIAQKAGEAIGYTLNGQDNGANTDSSLENIARILPARITGDAARVFTRMRKHIIDSARKNIPASQAGKMEFSLDSCAPVQVTAQDGTQILANESGSLSILSGRALIRTDADQLIESSLAQLSMGANAIASMQVNESELRVHCFTEPDSMKLVSGKYSIPLKWGREAVVLAHKASWLDVLPADGIARRNFAAYRMNQTDYIIADFAIESLLKSHEHLSEMRHAENGALKELREKLIKTAAAVRLATHARGSYSSRKQNEMLSRS